MDPPLSSEPSGRCLRRCKCTKRLSAALCKSKHGRKTPKRPAVRGGSFCWSSPISAAELLLAILPTSAC
eukprot:1639786-Prymnesium_polylepis.1